MSSVDKLCALCGREFTAKSVRAVYCSDECRARAFRQTNTGRHAPGHVGCEQVAGYVIQAHGLAAQFITASHAAPEQLQGMCGRLGAAMNDALEREGL